MEHVGQPRVVWLGTLSDGKAVSEGHRTHYVFPNQVAQQNSAVLDSLQAYLRQEELSLEPAELLCAPNTVVAIALIQPVHQHHALLPLLPEETCQYEVWRFLAAEELEGQLYYYRVLKMQGLLTKVSIGLVSGQHVRRSLGFLDVGWAEKCFTAGVLGVSDAEMRWWQQTCGGKPPTILLRTTTSFAFLIRARVWTRIVLPDMKVKGFSLLAGWEQEARGRRTDADLENDLLEMREQMTQVIPASVRTMLEGAFTPCPVLASRAGSLMVQDALQDTAQVLLGRSRPAVDSGELLQKLYLAARVVQASLDEQRFFQAENSSLIRNRKYSIHSLLDHFWLANCLHSDSQLREVLGHAVRICLPPAAASEAQRFLNESSEGHMRLPSPSTISRSRGRVDVGFMLLFRELLASKLESGVKVYVQCDATWQAHREYQICLFNFVETHDVPRLHQDPGGMLAHMER